MPKRASFRSRYDAALEAYLAEPGEAKLAEAYEVGRSALEEPMGVLAVAAVQFDALARALARLPEHAACVERVRALEGFFIETLSPFEMTHQGTREANQALRRLNQMLEDEAKRIAHALHDESGQLLAAVHLALGQLANDLPPALRDRLQEVRKLLTQTEQQLRRLSHELRPPMLDDLGLAAALQFLADGVSARCELPIEIDCSLARPQPPEIELVLYRVVQEAITNASRHAHASRVRVRLRLLRDAIVCSVADDGVGIEGRPRSGAGLGLLGVEERLKSVGGTLQIHSEPGKGTELVASIPLRGASE